MSDADDFMTRYLNNITSQYESSRFKPEYEPAEPETTKVTCRDGVELTVDIFRPATPGPYPTIVVRCPYPQQVELWKLHGEHLNRRGYAPLTLCRACGHAELALLADQFAALLRPPLRAATPDRSLRR